MQRAETGGRRTRMPVRRLQPRHPAAFLVDQDRRRRIAHRFAQLLNQRFDLVGRC